MKKIILFLGVFCFLIISGCSCSSFKYEITFAEHDGVVSTSCDKEDCLYSRGEDATIVVETSRHFKKIMNVFANKEKLQAKNLEDLNDSGNYFLEFTISDIKEDIKITYPSTDFYEVSYDVRVIPDASYAGTFNDRVDYMINRSIRANFLYAYKIVKDDEESTSNFETFGSFFNKIIAKNNGYKAGDTIEVYVKNAYRDEEGVSKYQQYLTNFASKSYGIRKRYPLDVSFDKESNITTYKLVVEDSVAFEILDFTYSNKVSTRVLFDGVNLNGATDSVYDSEAISSFKIYDSNDVEIVNLEDVKTATENNSVRIEVQFADATHRKIISALKDGLTLNGEKLNKSDYEVTSEGKLIINNVKAPYDYGSSYKGYYNMNEIGFCYQLEIDGVQEYVDSNEDFRKIDFQSIVDSFDSSSYEAEYSFLNERGTLKLGNVYYYDKSESIDIHLARGHYNDIYGIPTYKYDYKVTINDKYVIECNSEVEGVIQNNGFIVTGSSLDKYVIKIPSNFEGVTSLNLEKIKNQ